MTPPGYRTKTDRRTGVTTREKLMVTIPIDVMAVIRAEARAQQRSISNMILVYLTTHDAVVPGVGVAAPGKSPKRRKDMEKVDVVKPIDYHGRRRKTCVHRVPATSECLVCDR